MSKKLDLAIALAKYFHDGQMHGDKPYWTHLEAVADQMDTEDEKIVAWLHDIYEDTRLPHDTTDRIFGHMLPLYCLTRKDSDKYFTYIDKVKGDPTAIKVKMADLKHNLSCNPPESLRKRYEKALKILS